MVLAPEHPLVDRLTTPEPARGRRRLPRGRRAARATSTGPTWPRPRPASSPAATPINPVNGQRDPRLDRRLRADGLRHRRDHGRPRPRRARLRVRQDVRPADRPGRRPVARRGRRPARRRPSPSPASRSTRRNDEISPRRPADRRGEGGDHRLARRDAGSASKTINYKLRDWLFSRQRYWGEPFPILLDERRPRPRRPRVRAARPAARAGRLPPLGQARAAAGQGDGVGPLLREGSAARPTRCPSGPGRAGTTSATSTRRTTEQPWDPELERYWMPVDLYVGGAEHAVLHLLYSRFWHKVLFDRGHVSTPEPFQKLVNQGMILGETEYTGYRDDAGRWVSDVRGRGDRRRPPARRRARPSRRSSSTRSRSSRRGTGSSWPTTRESGSTPGPTRCRRAGAT